MSMHSTEKKFQQLHGQIELQTKQDVCTLVPLKSSDRSILLPSEVPRSDDDGSRLAFERSIGILCYPSVDISGSETFPKLVDDVRPLLLEDLPSEDEDGSLRNGSPDVDAQPDGASLRSAVFNLSTTIIGAGIMALPATMKVLGMFPGVIIILFMGVFSEISLEMVVHVITQWKTWSYGGMVYEARGKTGCFLAQIAIIVNNGGILIVYMIIMGDVMSGSKDHTGLFEGWAGSRGWWTNRSVVLLLTMLVVLAPLVSFKRIDSLEIPSAISVALALLFVVLSTGIAFIKLMKGNVAAPRMLPSFSSKKAVLDLLTVIPIMTNAFVCQFNVPTIYSELRERTATTMTKVGRISIGLCVAVYVATALSGYLLFGESTESDVLTNFDTDLGIPHSRFVNDVIRVGYVVHLFFVFPVIHFSFRETVDSVLFPKSQPLQENKLRFGLLTLVLLTLIYGGSTSIPNIWIAFKFTGATTALSLGFIFPALVVIKTGGGSKMERRLAWGIFLMAALLSIVGVTTQIYTTTTEES